MFKPTDLKISIGKALAAIAEEDRIGRVNYDALADALSEFTTLWGSRECVRYRESLGKTALMLPESAGRNPRGNVIEKNWRAFVSGGNYLAVLSPRTIKALQSVSNMEYLLYNLSAVHAFSDVVEGNAADIDQAFAGEEGAQR